MVVEGAGGPDPGISRLKSARVSERSGSESTYSQECGQPSRVGYQTYSYLSRPRLSSAMLSLNFGLVQMAGFGKYQITSKGNKKIFRNNIHIKC